MNRWHHFTALATSHALDCEGMSTFASSAQNLMHCLRGLEHLFEQTVGGIMFQQRASSRDLLTPVSPVVVRDPCLPPTFDLARHRLEIALNAVHAPRKEYRSG